MLAPGTFAPRVASLEGPVLLAFFKVSCPTCQLAFPFLDRLQPGTLRVVGISQDDAEPTAEFKTELGITLETILDPPPYPLSSAFRITTVPSLFVVEADGIISRCFEGFSQADLEELGRRAGAAVFRDGERVPRFKPG